MPAPAEPYHPYGSSPCCLRPITSNDRFALRSTPLEVAGVVDEPTRLGCLVHDLGKGEIPGEWAGTTDVVKDFICEISEGASCKGSFPGPEAAAVGVGDPSEPGF